MEPSQNQHSIDPDFLVPQLSTKLYRTTLSYLKRFYSEKFFEEICRELGMPADFLRADDNWVSVEFGRRFAALVRSKTNDNEVYRKIGRSFFDSENINPIEHQILKAAGPFGFFRMMAASYARTNQACTLTVEHQGLGNYAVTIRALRGTVYSDMVLNTLGALEGLEEFYNLKRFTIRLGAEITPGEEVSEFKLHVDFAASRYFFDLVVLGVSLTVFSAVVGYLIFLWESSAGVKVIPFLTAALFVTLAILMKTRKGLNILKKNVEMYYAKGREKNIQLYEKSELLNWRYREANMLRELSTELVSINDPQKVLQVCLNSLELKFDFRQIALFQVSKKRQRLFLSESRGFNDVRAKIGDVEFVYPNPNAKELFFASILESGESALIVDIPEYRKSILAENRMLIDLLKVNSIVACPIQTQTDKYGLLLVFRTEAQPFLTEEDKFLLEKVANFLALYFDNAANFAKEASLRRIFQQYVPAIVLEEFMQKGGETVLAEPKREEIISVFIDLRDFTSMSEKMSPERVVQIISRYTDFVSEIFSAQGAVIDNIVGDAVVMFFRCGADSAVELHKFMNAIHMLDAKWSELQAGMAQLGLDDFKLGIGAHIGPALVGNVGGSFKRSYTALGDTVNVASRLQSLSKKFPANLGEGHLTVIVSEEILRRLGLGSEMFSEKLRGRDELTHFGNLKKRDSAA